MGKIYDEGSTWSKWDLHVHSSSSFDYKYKGDDADEKLVQAWRDNEIRVVAITDHFLIDDVRIDKLRDLAKGEVTIFPGVELRTDKGDTNVHVILIFDDKMDVKRLREDFDSQMIRMHAKPKKNQSNENVYWDYKNIVDFAESHNAVISIHAGSKTSGIDDKISNALSVNMATKVEYSESVHIYEVGNESDIVNYCDKVFKHIDKRPIIICSDNHDPRDYALKQNLWIKSNRTFDGLKQAIIHCDDRVFVGELPPKEGNVKGHLEKYIKSICVRRCKKTQNETWFDFELPISTGLTTIIGNKGSGKSALADIIGYIGMSNNHENFSFMNNNRFGREDKALNMEYNGRIDWRIGDYNECHDFDIAFERGIELVKYLPQSYIEETCNNLDGNFQDEIDKVIFSYISEREKVSYSTLGGLIDSKMGEIINVEKEIRNDINSLNKQIIDLENKSSKSYFEHTMNNFRHYLNELDRHNNAKPKEVLKPKEDVEEKRLQEIEGYNKQISEYQEQIKVVNSEYSQCNAILERVERIQRTADKLTMDIVGVVNEVVYINAENILSIPLHTEGEFKVKGIEDNIKYFKNKIEEFDKLLNSDFAESDLVVKSDDGNDELRNVEDCTSLFAKISIIRRRIENYRNRLSKDERMYQNYLEDLKKWEEKKVYIIGNVDNIDSLSYWQRESQYLENQLKEDLSLLYATRVEKLGDLYDQVIKRKRVLDEIYRPVEKKLESVLSKIEDKISFEANPKMNADFAENFLSFVNQVSASSFRGKKEGRNKVDSILRKHNFSSKEGTINFVNEVYGNLTNDFDSVEKLLFNRQECYDFIFGLKYFNVGFSLNIGEKSLTQLSPGEKGNVLLIFYLALDKWNIPLIIDQPEDNLDNQSIYSKLVPCVIEAKKNRQVIIVTHNPNLALACDSELIIHSQKTNNENSVIDYTCGAIENVEIRKILIDILEGTEPAFDLRSSKYNGEHIPNKA